MNDKKFYDILKVLDEKINGLLNYRIEGSGGLKINGMNVVPNDIDVVVDEVAYEKLKKSFKEFIIRERRVEYKGSLVFECEVLDEEVEFWLYDEVEKRMLDRVLLKDFEGLKFKVLSLNAAIEFYSMIGRNDKVKMIK
jgi:hypothetical protein